MNRKLPSDLKHLASLAFRRSAHCAPLLKQFHALKKQIAATGHPDLIWNLYDWLLVPLSLWPLDFEGLAHFLLDSFSASASASLPDFKVQAASPARTSKFRVQSSPSDIQNPESRIQNQPAHIPSFHDSIIPLLKLIDGP